MKQKRSTVKVHLTIDVDVYDRLMVEAKEESRSLSRQIEHTLKTYWGERDRES